MVMEEQSHIVGSFDKDLMKIEQAMLEMAGLAGDQLAQAVRALIAGDQAEADAVIQSDKTIDDLQISIDDLTAKVIALRQPMAQDLRTIVAAMKIANELERIGDYGKSIAKRTEILAEEKPIKSAQKALKRMAKAVGTMLTDVMDAYVARNDDKAMEIRVRDEEVDAMHDALLRELLTYMMEDPRNITASMHLLFMAKMVERAGDHVTNVAEQVHYIITGEIVDDDVRPGS